MKTNFQSRFPFALSASIVAVLSATAIVFAARSEQDSQPAAPQTKPVPDTAPPAANPRATAAPSVRTVQGTQPAPQVRPAPRPVPMPPQQPAVPAGGDPRNTDRSIPNSEVPELQNGQVRTFSTPGTTLPSTNNVPQGVGFNNQGGIVNPDQLQSDAMNHVHYHYHYDSAGGFVGNVQPGYATNIQYTNPDNLNQPVNPMNAQAYGPGNPPPMNEAGGGMYGGNYQNSRVGNNGSGGVPVVWNPYLAGGQGMLTYGAGSCEGFND